MMDLKEVIIQRRFESDSEYLVNAVVIVVPGKKTNELMKVLGEKLPLQRGFLGHLKRVRKSSKPENQQNGYVEFLLCSESVLHEVRSQIEEDSDAREVLALVDEVTIAQEVISVCKYAPESKSEFELWNKYWPINFHPNELERIRNKTFSAAERQTLNTFYYTQLIDDTERNLSDYGLQRFGAMIVNPEHFLESAVICSSHQVLCRYTEQERNRIISNPITSPVMLCVDEVAKISRRLLPGKEKLPRGDYLCTGLDCFVYEELDVMNAMALVHSRIRHVYFIVANELFGCFKSTSFHLHCLKALNHHYRVFHYMDPAIETESSKSAAPLTTSSDVGKES